MTVRIWNAERGVNQTTVGDQGAPSITMLGDGTLVVVWHDMSQGGGDIMGRVFFSDGNALTDEFKIADGAAQQVDPAVVALADGGFEVVWEQTGADGVELFRRTYGANLQPEHEAIASTAAGSVEVSVSSTGSGEGYVQVFEYATDIYYAKYDTSGALIDGGKVNTTSAGAQAAPDVAVLASGRFVVVWSDGGTDIRARIYNANGVAFTANDFTISPASGQLGLLPSVTALEDGGFVVAWTDNDANSYGTKLRVYNADGQSTTSTLLANGVVTGAQVSAEVVALKEGGFLTLWNDVSTASLQGQQFAGNGDRIGGAFAVTTSDVVNGFDRAVSATVLEDGRIAVAFETTQADNGGVRLQIIDPRNGAVNGTADGESLFGGAFDDQIVARGGDDSAWGGRGGDLIWGGTGGDDLNGNEGDDALYGGEGNDQLYGSDGDDLLDGGDGDDFLSAGGGANEISGGKGVDTVAFHQGGDIVVELSNDGEGAAFVGGIRVDVLFDVENIITDAGDDTLIGNDLDNVLDGGEAGDDLLRGGGGKDTLDGGDGSDTADYREKTAALLVQLNGVNEVDVKVGGVVEDRIEAIENLLGGAAGDIFQGDAGANLLNGYGGNDALRGGGGKDTLLGGAGLDTADYRDKAQAVSVTLSGAVLTDVKVGGVVEDRLADIEVVWGGAAADTLTGDGLANLFRGGGGADVLNGGGGVDSVDFRDKTAAVVLTLAGANEAVATVGGVAEDKIRNIENAYGGSAGDSLLGDGLANQLFGEGGTDVLRGGGGADALTGGAMADVFYFGALSESTVAAAGRDTIKDFSHAQGDKINLSAIDAVAGGADNAFTFGTMAAGQAGRVQVTADGAGKYLVQGDVTGDGQADFAISVVSATLLDATDFVL